MDSTTTRLTFGVSLTLLAASSSAQDPAQIRRLKAPPKDAGVYHLATGTWTRGDNASLQATSKVLYNNTAISGYFGVSNTHEINWTDEGRLPSTSGHANAKDDLYVVQGFQVATCDAGVLGRLNFGIEFYELYTACSDPRTNGSLIFSQTASIPGLSGSGTSACWIHTFDLTGTSLEFAISGDGDGVFDGTSSLDNFGWQLHLDDNQATTQMFGPILAYDPAGYFGCAASEGDGTYYQSGTCSSPYGFGNFGSGLGLADRRYIWSPGSNPHEPNGCYWFGGYSTNASASGFWMVVYGEGVGGSDNYCTGSENSVGFGRIGISGDLDAATPDEVVSAIDVPNGPGIFIHGGIQVAVPFGCGWLCTGADIHRGNVVTTGGTNVATYAYDGTTSKRDLSGFAGSTRNFQYWFRDPQRYPPCFHTKTNLSDGISVDLE